MPASIHKVIPWVLFVVVAIPVALLFGKTGLLWEVIFGGFAGVAVFGVSTYVLRSFDPVNQEQAARRVERQSQFQTAFFEAQQKALDESALLEAGKLGTASGERIAKARAVQLAKDLDPQGSGFQSVMAKIGTGMMKAGKNVVENMNNDQANVRITNPLVELTKGMDPYEDAVQRRKAKQRNASQSKQ